MCTFYYYADKIYHTTLKNCKECNLHTEFRTLRTHALYNQILSLEYMYFVWNEIFTRAIKLEWNLFWTKQNIFQVDSKIFTMYDIYNMCYYFRKRKCLQGQPRFRRLKPSCSPKSFVDSTYQRYNRFFHLVHKELPYFSQTSTRKPVRPSKFCVTLSLSRMQITTVSSTCPWLLLSHPICPLSTCRTRNIHPRLYLLFRSCALATVSLKRTEKCF